MDRLSLKAQEREILGKKVKSLRKHGLIPGHVFGKGVEGENVAVQARDFIKVAEEAGETGLIDLKIGEEKVRPVLIRDLDHNPLTGELLNIDFYQVNLSEKVNVPVPIVLAGEEPESVHMGESVVLQTLNEVQIEALPTDLIDEIQVDITPLKEIGDSITIADLNYDREKITVLAEPDEVVVKLDTAVTEEMKQLMEEQVAEAAAAAEAQAVEEGVEPPEGETPEGEEVAPEGETPTETGEVAKEEKV